MFYKFYQNNSGGYIITNEEVGQFVIIEADTEEDAVDKLLYVTRDHSEYCVCCGERWPTYSCTKYETADEAIKDTRADTFWSGTSVIYFKTGLRTIFEH